MRWKTIVYGSALALALFVVPASAAPITGILNFSGSATVTAATIDWSPGGTGEGIAVIFEDSEGYFDGIEVPIPLQTVDTLDLPAGPFPVASFLNDFQTGNAQYNDLSFTLEGFVIPGIPVCGTADSSGIAGDVEGDEPGESCVAFAGSPFALELGSDLLSTDINFNVFGSFVDPSFGDDGSLNDATGLYTSNLSDMTPLQLQAHILGGGSATSSYSVEYNAEGVVVPEPVTLALTGFGLAAMGYRLRRRRQS